MASILDNIKFDIQTIIASLTLVLSILCYVIIPSTNKAKDKNDQNKFKFLHNLSVISTVIILITNLSLVFFKNIIMPDNILTFKQKIKLYHELKSFFQNVDLKNHPMTIKEIDSMIDKLKLWGKELRARQLYYDV